ncbi:hypothetical protein V8F20_009397 [Naviculisporaceae sp. PSN 640]
MRESQSFILTCLTHLQPLLIICVLVSPTAYHYLLYQTFRVGIMASQNRSSLSSVDTGQRDHLLSVYTDHEKGSLDDDNAPFLPRTPPSEPQFQLWRQIFQYLLLVLSVFAVSSILASIFTSVQSSPHREVYSLNASLSKAEAFPDGFLSCGHSPSEARSKNCTFDLMLSTWIHESCADRDMMETYLAQGQYHYFYDKDRAIPMTEEEARKGEYKTLWTDGEFHLAHCVYLMDMQIRAYKTGKPIEVGIFNHRHNLHCVNLTLGLEGEVKTRVTKLHALFGGCGFPRGR